MASVSLKPLSLEVSLMAAQLVAVEVPGVTENMIAKSVLEAGRKVKPHEQTMAADVAAHLQSVAAILKSNDLTDADLSAEAQRMTEKNLLDAAAFYQTITQTKRSIEALTIAVPGHATIGSTTGVLLRTPKAEHFDIYININNALCRASKSATQLTASLATVGGVKPFDPFT